MQTKQMGRAALKRREAFANRGRPIVIRSNKRQPTIDEFRYDHDLKIT